MRVPQRWSRIAIVVGLAAMVVGLVDPLEGFPVVLAGTAMASLGAMLGGSPYRRLVYIAFGLTVAGAVAMVVLSMLGGIGGNAGRSMWWGIFILPYPVGWIVGVIGSAAALVESWRANRAANDVVAAHSEGGRPRARSG